MEVRYVKAFLHRLETEKEYDHGLPVEVVTAFRKRMQMIRAAPKKDVLDVLQSFRLEQLEETRERQYSIRFHEQNTAIGICSAVYDSNHRYTTQLTDQYRLIVEFHSGAVDKVVAVVDMEDHH